MFSHIMVGVSDFNRAMAFYTPVLQALGVQFRFMEEDRPWAGWQLGIPGQRDRSFRSIVTDDSGRT
jgi:hypothetical protein